MYIKYLLIKLENQNTESHTIEGIALQDNQDSASRSFGCYLVKFWLNSDGYLVEFWWILS